MSERLPVLPTSVGVGPGFGLGDVESSESARNDRYLREIAEHVPGMAYRVHLPLEGDGQAHYSFVSPGIRYIYGVDPEQLLADARLLRRFRHPDDMAHVDAAVSAALARAAPLNVAFRIVVGGQLKWVQMSSSAVVGGLREQVRVGVVLDVTAQQQADALRGERDRADGERRQMLEFLSRVSHELRTPLNGILGFAQLIEMESDTPGLQRRWARQLLDSGRHLLALVDDVLDLTGARSGRMPVQLDEVDLAPVLREAWGMVRADAEARELLFSGVPLARGDLAVRADRRRLLQVLVNLLSNAVKYNRTAGSVDLAVEREGDAEGERVRIDVIDSGPGLTPQQMARLFLPFDRLGAQHGSVPGTGLGLALSRQLAESMDGTLHADSVAGEGCTFSLRLPLAAPLAAPVAGCD